MLLETVPVFPLATTFAKAPTVGEFSETVRRLVTDIVPEPGVTLYVITVALAGQDNGTYVMNVVLGPVKPS